jgi:hypothetical protein
MPSGPDVVDAQADTTSSLANHSAALESIVDTLNRVILHAYKEA